MKTSKWRQVIDEHVKPALDWFSEQGITPTLRTLFYRLVSLLVIPNTVNSYKSLSKCIVKARKLGLLHWDCIADEGRLVVNDFNEYGSPNEYIRLGIRYLLHASENFTIPKWYRQPHYVEVWIEKQALADTFHSFLEDKQVRIAVNKGYSSWTFLSENCKRLQKVMKKDPSIQIHILYFGDYDPSGIDMDRHLTEAFNHFGLQDAIDFQRIAVTMEQIHRFNLPPKPEDAETLKKLDNDSRTKKFIERHGGQLFAVELDALLALVPDEFKRLVHRSVDRFYDKNVYENELSNIPSSKDIDRLVIKEIGSLRFELKERITKNKER